MTIYEKLEIAAVTVTDVRLSAHEVERVFTALTWAREILESLNADDADTEGGNSKLSGLDEESES